MANNILSALEKERKKLIDNITNRIDDELNISSSIHIFNSSKNKAIELTSNFIKILDDEINNYFNSNKDEIIINTNIINSNKLGFKDDITTLINYNKSGEYNKEITIKKLKEIYKSKNIDINNNIFEYIRSSYNEAFVAYSAYKKYDEKYGQYILTNEDIDNNKIKRKDPLLPINYIPLSQSDAKEYFNLVIKFYNEQDPHSTELIALLIMFNEIKLIHHEINISSIKKSKGLKLIRKYGLLLFEILKPHIKSLFKKMVNSILDSTNECVKISDNYNKNQEYLEDTSSSEIDNTLDILNDFSDLNLTGPQMSSSILKHIEENPSIVNIDKELSGIYKIDENCCLVPVQNNKEYEFGYWAVIEMCNTITEYKWYVKPGDRLYKGLKIASFINHEGLTIDVYSPIDNGVVIKEKLFNTNYNNIVISDYGNNVNNTEDIQNLYNKFTEIYINKNNIRDLFYNIYGECIYPFIAYNKNYNYSELSPYNINRKHSSTIYNINKRNINKLKDEFIKEQINNNYEEQIKNSNGDYNILENIKIKAETDINNFIFKQLYNTITPIFNFKTQQTKVTNSLGDLRYLGINYYLDILLLLNNINNTKSIDNNWLDDFYHIILGIISKRLRLEVKSHIKTRNELLNYYNTNIKRIFNNHSIIYNDKLNYESLNKLHRYNNKFNLNTYITDDLNIINFELALEVQNLYNVINDIIIKLPENIEENKVGISNNDIKKLIKQECNIIKDFFDRAYKAYFKYEREENDLLKEFDKHVYNFTPEFDIETLSGQYKIYQINNSNRYKIEYNTIDLSNKTLGDMNAKELFDDELSPYTQVPIDSLKYWRKHFALDTLISISYLVTWFILPIGKRIKLPVIYTPIKVLNSNGIIFVFGFGFAGLGTYPLLLVCNMNTTQSTLAVGLLTALDAIKSKYYGIIDNSLVNSYKAINNNIQDTLSDIADTTNRINDLDILIEKNKVLLNDTESLLESVNKKLINTKEFDKQLIELSKIENKLKLYDDKIKVKIK